MSDHGIISQIDLVSMRCQITGHLPVPEERMRVFQRVTLRVVAVVLVDN